MPVLIIRHGLSEANNRENIGGLAFASGEAPLMQKGREQAEALGLTLLGDFGINPREHTPATSELKRTQETAMCAGFLTVNTYARLNEVDHGVDLRQLRGMLDEGQLPAAALNAAESILEDPPEEDIWVSHGLVIVSLSHVLGVYQERRLVPKFCEIRELPI